MKTKFLFFAVLFFALYSNASYSQYYGNNNRAQRPQMGSDRPSKKNEKIDYAESVVASLDKELKLDGLQQAAIKTIINDNKNSLEEISKMDIPFPEKKGKMQVINDKISGEILKLLSKEQSDKFLKIKEEREKKALTN